LELFAGETSLLLSQSISIKQITSRWDQSRPNQLITQHRAAPLPKAFKSSFHFRFGPGAYVEEIDSPDILMRLICLSDSPNLLTRSCQLLLELASCSGRYLDLSRVILLGFGRFGTRLTRTVFPRHTLRDGHFAVAQEDNRTVDRLVHASQRLRHRLHAVHGHDCCLLLDTNLHTVPTRITIILHINPTLRAINTTVVVPAWIGATVRPILTATRCTTVSNEND
jgi:hypothetical protein